jgi:hypothetical protein
MEMSELKEYLRIDDDSSDGYLNILILLSSEICLNFLRLEQLPDNESVKTARLLICGYFFENRQGTKENIPFAVYNLLMPYRKSVF